MESNRRPASETGKNLKQTADEDEVVRNPNPKANENIRVRSEQPERQTDETSNSAGWEITDGEDG